VLRIAYELRAAFVAGGCETRYPDCHRQVRHRVRDEGAEIWLEGKHSSQDAVLDSRRSERELSSAPVRLQQRSALHDAHTKLPD